VGEAKRRGTFEERKGLAIKLNGIKKQRSGKSVLIKLPPPLNPSALTRIIKMCSLIQYGAG